MGEHDHITEHHLLSAVREPESPGRAAGRQAASAPAEFPTFGEAARRHFENSASPMRIFDLETLKYLAVNAAAVRFYGHSREEFLALTVKATRHPAEYDALAAGLADQADYLRHRPSRRHVKKSGEVAVVETITQDILFDGHRARLSLTLNLTDRMRMHELLRQRQQEFESLADNLPDLVARYDPERRFAYVNAAVEKLFGRARSDFIGRTQREAGLPADLVARYDESLPFVFGTGSPHKVEFRIATAEGERLFEALHVPERDAGGKVAAVICVARDITEHKQAERALREVQQHLQVAVRGGGVGLYDWDLKTGAVYFSPEWKRQLGYGDHEFPNDVGEWQRRIHPDDRARVAATIQTFLDRPGPDYVQEYRLFHKNGSYRWILSRASARLGDDGEVERMFGCHVDITEQKQAEANRLESAVRQRDALVREVHHRIKNSLQGVAGLLRHRITKNPAMAPEIEETIGQLQSVALVYGLQETRPDGLLSLVTIMDAICASAEGLIGGRVERVFERKSRRPACVAGQEAVSVAFALNELVFNALKHQSARAGEKRARVTLRESPHEAEIRITNCGRLPKGFDFSQGRAVGGGLGLVRTLLASPGGSIAFNGGRNKVEVVLNLRPPLLAERQHAAAT